MYDIAEEQGPSGVFWHDISVHAYQQSQAEFDPELYEENAETLRTIMRHHNTYGQLWNSEVGWDTLPGGSACARNICKTFVSSKSSEALPPGGFDRTCGWLFREGSARCGC